MDPALVATALVSIAITGGSAVILWRKTLRDSERALAEQRARIQELEKGQHLIESDFLARRHQLELAHSDAMRAARAAAFEEGRLLGQSEANASRVTELTELRQTLLAKFEADRDLAVADTRERVRAEYELQSKLFTVKISPYVCVEEERKLLGHHYRTTTGYQYQLLVNGIPAFAPHVVAEQTELKKVINPEVEQLLLKAAEKAASAAISAYLGGNAQFARLAEPILKRVPR